MAEKDDRDGWEETAEMAEVLTRRPVFPRNSSNCPRRGRTRSTPSSLPSGQGSGVELLPFSPSGFQRELTGLSLRRSRSARTTAPIVQMPNTSPSIPPITVWLSGPMPCSPNSQPTWSSCRRESGN